MKSIALVGMNGSSTFPVIRTFDSPTVFAALLDEKQGGRFQIEPQLTDMRIRQLYLPDTNILLTRFLAEEGVAELTDFMPIEKDTGQPNEIVRIFQLRLFVERLFGIRFAATKTVRAFSRVKVAGEVMGALVHCSSVRYAVIQASSKKDRPERLVIAYHDENCLRDLIAAPSIIGLGFASREEAIANLEGHVSDAAPSKQKPRITAMFHASHANVELAGGHGLVKHRRIPQSVVQSALAAIIALFYSKNIVSVMIRMALGASF